MRHLVVILVALSMASYALGSTTTRVQAAESPKIVDLYPKFGAHIANCTKSHGFDPSTTDVDKHSLAPGELPWRECVYLGIDKYIIGHSTVPHIYKQIVAADRAMTEQIAQGTLTRPVRRFRIESMIETIRTEEMNQRVILLMQANELNDFVSRQQELQDISRMHNQAMEGLRALRGLNLR